MDKRTNKKITDFITAVNERYPKLVTAYIFGSYVKNKIRPDSDIDIALIIDDLKDEERFDVQVQLILLASKFDLRIEPHPISKNDFNSCNPFAYEIRRTGIEIKPPAHDFSLK